MHVSSILLRLGQWARRVPPGLQMFLATLTVIDHASAAEVPSGFVVDTLAENLNAATAITIDRSGRIFILDQTGKIRIFTQGKLLETPVLELDVDAYWERGLIGIALHPNFPESPYIYLNHTPAQPFTHHRISRFTVSGDQADPRSEVVLFEGDDQAKLGGNVPHGHQGGPIRFGPDEKLYIALGEQTAGQPSQQLDSLLGKILRLNPDGSIPQDNPFYQQTTGKYRSIWATGIRNPYGLEFHPVSGELYENDVGQSAWEEINIIKRGANYGWPLAEGVSEDPRFTNPIHAYPPVVGRSITGGTFYRGGEQAFPSTYHGKYFFLDFMNHWIRTLSPDDPGSSQLFGKNFNGPVDIQNGPDGSLYVLNRGTIWRDNKRHVANAGSLQRIRYLAIARETSTSADTFPPKLSDTKHFASTTNLEPVSGFYAFRLNAPPWLPRVNTRLWIRVPDEKTIQPTSNGIWRFPQGTTIIQHFDTTKGHRLETRIYRATDSDCFEAAAYRWHESQSEALLVSDPEIVSPPGEPERYWLSPGQESCLNLETVVSGFQLPLTTRQLDVRPNNGPTQLAMWRQRGWLRVAPNKFTGATRLVALDDPGASLEAKVRSYLDANCASCHFPGGPSRGGFDARFTTPLVDQNVINGIPIAGDLGIPGARIVVPGNPEKSLLYQRLKSRDFFRMPPVALNADASPILEPLHQWITQLKP